MKYVIAVIIALLLSGPASAESFKGYDCTQDCSGHKAGYEWAQRKNISDAADCRGNSNSFIEGCLAAVAESFNPNAIAPAAGDDTPTPTDTHDPFALQPFHSDPFSPSTLPGLGN